MTQETLKKIIELRRRCSENITSNFTDEERRSSSNIGSNLTDEEKIKISSETPESADGIYHNSNGTGGHPYLVINDERIEIDMEDVDAIIKYSQSNTGSNKE